MSKFRKGDIVGRISYNKDVIFEITNIIKTSNKEIYILKGITERIEADSPPEDLEIMDKRIVNKKIKLTEDKVLNRIEKYMKNESYMIKKKNNLFNFSDIDSVFMKDELKKKIQKVFEDCAEEAKAELKELGVKYE